MTTHGDTIRRRQIAYRLLDRIDSLSFVPSLNWLRFVRWLLIMAAIACYAAGWLYIGAWWFQALLAIATWIAIEIAIVGRSVVEVLRRDRE